jgi:hypothetical protein
MKKMHGSASSKKFAVGSIAEGAGNGLRIPEDPEHRGEWKSLQAACRHRSRCRQIQRLFDICVSLERSEVHAQNETVLSGVSTFVLDQKLMIH